MSLCKKFGAEAVYVTATAKSSQKLFDKLSFDKVKYVDYKDYKNADGKQIIFPKDGTIGGYLYMKSLKD